MYLPDKNTVEAREIKGLLAGVHITVDARLWSETANQDSATPDLKKKRTERLKFISKILEELEQWQWPTDTPPNIKLYIEANTDKPETARIDFIIQSSRNNTEWINTL